MKGLYLCQNNQYIDKVSKKKEELTLLAKSNGTEIMLERIPQGVTFYMEPAKNSDLMEFVYIIEGSLSHKDEKITRTLKEGDYFYVYRLKEPAYFKTLSDVKMLYITTEPVFNYLSGEIEELNNIVKRIGEKDSYDDEENEELSDYAMKIGEKLGLRRDQIELLYFAALFYDIGKIAIPDLILEKPEKLTDVEFETVKKHVIYGQEAVKGTFLEKIGDIILQHHERIDGKGYPNGLKDEEILIEAKIIAVLDGYNAMISDRPYRSKMSPSMAVEELKRCSGTQYDGKIVHILEEILIEDGQL